MKIKFLIKEFLFHLKNSFIVINEGARIKDKIIMIIYYITHILNFLFLTSPNNKLLKNISIKNSHGLFISCNNRWSVQSLSSAFEPETKNSIDLKEGVFIDIGANVGAYSLILAKKLKNLVVIAIEPETKNFDLLKKNIALNNLSNITALNQGCFSYKTKMNLYISLRGLGLHSIIKKVGKFKSIIQVDKLDNIVNGLKLTRIDLIKIDVEGAEYEVIRGASKILKKYHPQLIIEIWDNKRFNKIFDLLKKFNYKLKKRIYNESNYIFS